jgi:hypothetical protein
MAACAEACSNSTGSALEAFADVQMRIVCIGLWLLFAIANARFAGYVWRGWRDRDSCGCISKCFMRAPLRAMLAAFVNMLFPIANTVFFPSASTNTRTPVAVLTFVASVVVLAYLLVIVYTFLNPRGCHNQPCLLETDTQVNDGDNAADAMTLLEDRLLSPGAAWERELSVALAKK